MFDSQQDLRLTRYLVVACIILPISLLSGCFRYGAMPERPCVLSSADQIRCSNGGSAELLFFRDKRNNEHIRGVAIRHIGGEEEWICPERGYKVKNGSLSFSDSKPDTFSDVAARWDGSLSGDKSIIFFMCGQPKLSKSGRDVVVEKQGGFFFQTIRYPISIPTANKKR